MPAKLTLQDFVDCARAVHGDRYGYAFSVYQGNHVKLMIHCREHGFFEMTPGNHKSGHGCPRCSGTNISLKKRSSFSEFVEKATLVHSNQYDYSQVNYVNNSTKIIIICSQHGPFEQTPASHTSGNGCPKCAGKNKTTHDVIDIFRKVNGDKYDYSKFIHLGAHKKGIIVCKQHGEFEQTTNNHIRGRGCPGCAEYGFDRTKPGYIYLLRSDCGVYCKVGITHSPKQRHSKLRRATPFKFDVVECLKGPGSLVFSTEKELLTSTPPVVFDSVFDGSTEWRLWSDDLRHKLLTSMSGGCHV